MFFPKDAIDVLNRQQMRGIEGQLFNKVNETQEDLSMSKFDLRAKQLHLAAIRAQVSVVVLAICVSYGHMPEKISLPDAKCRYMYMYEP